MKKKKSNPVRWRDVKLSFFVYTHLLLKNWKKLDVIQEILDRMNILFAITRQPMNVLQDRW